MKNRILTFFCVFVLGINTIYSQRLSNFEIDLQEAQQGYPGAQYKMGCRYKYGWDVQEDYSQAVYWLRKAAEQGYAKAQQDLGWMYQEGQGVPKDRSQVKYWFDKAKEHSAVKVNGVWYDFNREEKTALVTREITFKGKDGWSASSGGYSGSVVIPSSVVYGGVSYRVTAIDDEAISWSGVTSISIPSSVNSIGEEAFAHNSSLESIIIPSSVTRIGGKVLTGCDNLASIIVESGNPVFDSRNNCNAIIRSKNNELIAGCKNTIIPNNVTGIGNYAFWWCRKLTSIWIPDNVAYIGEWVFCNCESLVSIRIPKSVKVIGEQVLSGCCGLEHIVVEYGNPVFDSRNNCNAIIRTKNNELIAGCKNTVIPNSVKVIGKDAFYDYKSLTSLTIPYGVERIGGAAFWYCENLEKVSLPSSINFVGSWAFCGCEKMQSISYPKGLDLSDTHISSSTQKNSYVPTSTFSSGFEASLSAANGGDKDAQKSVGDSYYYGDVVSQDYKQAVYWYRKAAEQGHPEAQSALGRMYFVGQGMAQDYNQAVYWWRKAAEQGEKSAQFNFGNMYENGKGIAQDYNQAVYWYRKAAEQGEMSAQNSLGLLYVRGSGVVQDYNQAVHWYSKAAGQGFAEGQNNLGEMYEKGRGVVKDYNQAIFWYRKAAEQGEINAHCNLGRMYEYGEGVIKDCNAAMAWYQKAADHGVVYAQEHYQTLANMGYGKSLKVLPPFLTIDEGSISFIDSSNNNIIEAEEQCELKFVVKNEGQGSARNCEVIVKISGESSGIMVQGIKLPTIGAGEIYSVSIPINSNLYTKDGKAIFSVEVYEPSGWGVAPFDLSVLTKAYEPPMLKVVDYKVSSQSGKIRKVEPFKINFNLQNVQYGEAEQVKVKIILPEYVYSMGETEFSFPSIKSGETKAMDLVLAVNRNFSSENVPVTISIQEKYGKYSENRTLDIPLNQTISNTVNIAASNNVNPSRKPIELAMMSSDIDRDIPVSAAQNENTLVLIVANEHYQSMPTVPYAVNDGNVFKEYCIKTLGIPQDNVMYQSDVTLNGFRQKVALLQKKAQARAQRGMDTHIIFYYTGHGMPDVNTQSAYLMPVDGFDENVSTGYKLDYLYQILGQMQANTITVFLDACFSGVNRNDKSLAVHKGARLTAKSGAPTGNMVIFAASQGNQTASVNDKEKHGLFTYCLLKKLKATKGDISLSDLANYLIGEVNMKSLDLFEKEQIPSVVASPEVENQWQNWKLK